MYDALAEVVGETGAAAILGIVAAAVTALGLGAEVSGYQQFVAGHTTIALWLAAFGGVVTYAGAYVLGYQTVLAREA